MIPPVVDSYIAGESPRDAVERASYLERRGVTALLNRLGEHHEDEAAVEADVEEYVELVGLLDRADVTAALSPKPTQIGLDVSRELFEDSLDRLLAAAREADVFVWLDMEDTSTTDATLEAVVERERPDLGVCLQANLRRTDDDLRRLADHPGAVRFVKGAYSPSRDVAYRGDDVERAFRELVDFALSGEFEPSVALGTHDLDLVRYAERVSSREFEVQMLMGVREGDLFEMAGERPVAQYVPYGSEWMSYFYRRLRENRRGWRLAA
ncbi:MAG: proline dehydrogenase family protein, partial [Halobacteriales archaeon]